MPTLSTSDFKFKTLDGRVEVELCLETRTLLFICAECRALLLESSMDVVEDVGDVPLVVDALSDSVQTALAAHTCLAYRAEVLEEVAAVIDAASRVPTRQRREPFGQQALGRVAAPATEALRNFGRVAGRVTVHPHHTRVCKAAKCSKCGMLIDERRLQHMGGETFCCEECIQELEAEQGSKKGLRVIRF